MEQTQAFTECWHRDGPRLMAYARRHVAPDEADDVVAETFAIAWRRWADVPDPAIGWLLRTAQGVMRNRTRSARRRRRLATRVLLLGNAASAASDTADAVVRRDMALRRLAELSEEQREALLLVTWDGLTSLEAAEVLGLSPAAFRKRVSRARERLNHDDPPPRATRAALVQCPTPQEMS
jgi:RNA polymerase sigma factor (sigma-70 family)